MSIKERKKKNSFPVTKLGQQYSIQLSISKGSTKLIKKLSIKENCKVTIVSNINDV